MTTKPFTHLDAQGQAIMVDVGQKPSTRRLAEARGEIKVGPEVMEAIVRQSLKKGDVLGVARVAGLMGAKKTSELIPLCHQVFIAKCSVDFELDEKLSRVRVVCRVASLGQTGVEMEALTGVSAALLAIYDMCKALDKSMVIGPIWLTEKSGGQSGDFKRELSPKSQDAL
jgi:cyclic pyranopterin phosphate synthase